MKLSYGYIIDPLTPSKNPSRLYYIKLIFDDYYYDSIYSISTILNINILTFKLILYKNNLYKIEYSHIYFENLKDIKNVIEELEPYMIMQKMVE